MAAAVPPETLAEVEAVCRRWELAFAVVGEVTGDGMLRAFHDGDVVGEIPARFLTDECPRYRIPATPAPPPPPETPAPPTPHEDALLALLASPNVRSRAWVYRQYDHLVGSRTVRRPSLDAAVLRLRPGLRGLAVSLDGSGRACRAAPRTGGAAAVLEAARNVACAGGRPLAVTDCLNFGNPEKPEVTWELAEAIEGMAQACEALGVPVVSGNVSLYNETDGRRIHPTPVVGCVGLVSDVRKLPGAWRDGDVVLVAGTPALTLAATEYQAVVGGGGGAPAALDLAAEAALVEFLWRAAPLMSLAHDAAEGGLAVALAEAAVASGVGAELELPDDPVALFGEGGGQVVLACERETVSRLVSRLPATVPLRELGVVGGDALAGVALARLGEAWAT
jgi:phosphoribosylformylglycinamidine synthase